MAKTILWDSPIFGPVHSRRLGISLGINLQPADGKVCSFDCLYCECGLNDDHRPQFRRPSREAVRETLERKLHEMAAEGVRPDVLTFAGNGEPTGHPHFPEIIDDTIHLRDRYCPEAKVSVLSNATFCDRPKVHDALLKVDNNILKLDTVDAGYISLVDRPTQPSYSVEDVISWCKDFHSHCIIQTMFMQGTYQGQSVSNISEAYVTPWLEALKRIQPSQVMIYTIDRNTPVPGLEKATHEQLDSIKEQVLSLGIDCTASY